MNLRAKIALLGMLAVTPTPNLEASEFFVTSVVRDFPMKSGEASYKDIYINAGTNNGLKKGIILDAFRRMVVQDSINSKVLGSTEVKVARLRVIHIDRTYAIARTVKMYEKENTPVSGYDGVMIGDLIQVSDKQN